MESQWRAASRVAEGRRFELDLLSLWTKGFREVRGLVLDEVVSTYEDEAHTVLGQLGMGDWEVSVSVASKGHLTSGLDIVIMTTQGESCAAESLSGGESTRLEIAMEMALSNLIQAHLGAYTSLEVWDEPSAYLNSVEPLVDLLKARSASKDCAVVYIDHKGVTNFSFDDVLLVVKDDTGSHITREVSSA